MNPLKETVKLGDMGWKARGPERERVQDRRRIAMIKNRDKEEEGEEGEVPIPMHKKRVNFGIGMRGGWG